MPATKKTATKKAPSKKTATKKTATQKSASTTKTATKKTATKKTATKKAPSTTKKAVTLLSGGNPQVAMGHGDAPVQEWIAAAPGFKGEAARWLDALIEKTVPGVHKAVKWNTPMYEAPRETRGAKALEAHKNGLEPNAWFVAMHALKNALQVTFFRGASLDPVPPGPSKVKDTRYFHIKDGDVLDDAQMVKWLQQASVLPGEKI